jgi:hypothetical protein
MYARCPRMRPRCSKSIGVARRGRAHPSSGRPFSLGHSAVEYLTEGMYLSIQTREELGLRQARRQIGRVLSYADYVAHLGRYVLCLLCRCRAFPQAARGAREPVTSTATADIDFGSRRPTIPARRPVFPAPSRRVPSRSNHHHADRIESGSMLPSRSWLGGNKEG